LKENEMKMKFFPNAATLFSAALVVAATLCSAMPATGQYSASMGVATGQSSVSGQGTEVNGSVPTGSATTDVVRLTLRDAINRALRYNLASIESGENTRIARGQKLLALSQLLPQVSVGASEHVEQVNLDTLGLRVPGIPTIAGPFSYSSADVNVSTTLFSFESIQRFRAARTAEEAACADVSAVLLSSQKQTRKGRAGCHSLKGAH
jgi:outer membrane protein TolC